MANPTTTARTTPTGIYLKDGHSTKIAFNRAAAANFWEVEVQPPGIEGGDPISITTMHNVTWRTFYPKTLQTLTPFTVVAAWDPIFYNEALNNLINDNGSITVHFPDGSTIDFFGWLQSYQPQSNKEGEMPMANLQVVPSNYDPVGRVEAGPVLTLVSGT